MLAAGRELARKTRRNLEAPVAVVDALEAAATLPFAEGCARERAIFFELAKSEQAKALIHAFFAERGVSKVPGISKDTVAAPVNRIGIVGAGTMGGGIAMACANAGIAVRITDATAAGLDAGMATIRKNYDVSVKRGRFTPAMVEERMSRIVPQVGYEGFGQVDLVIEAVFENWRSRRRSLARRSPRVVKPTGSSRPIRRRSTSTRSPRRRLPSRWSGCISSAQPTSCGCVEIVRGAATSPETLAKRQAVAKRLGKVGVVVGNCRGFVGNRMMFPYMYEAQFLVEEGATPQQVDEALTGFGMAMGIFAVDDMAGLDVAWRVRQELNQFSEPGARKPLVADRLCEMGRFGQKTGKGWYMYGEDRKPQADPEVLSLIEQLAVANGIQRRSFTKEEIIERTIYALINEGARVLDEGFALRAADIDVIYTNGYGFPAWRGGPDVLCGPCRVEKIYDRVSAFHRELGDRWAPAPLLEKLAREGTTFKELDKRRAGALVGASS